MHLNSSEVLQMSQIDLGAAVMDLSVPAGWIL